MLLKLSMKPTEEHKLMEEEEPRRRPIQIRYYLATIIGHTCVHIPVKFYYRKYILKKKSSGEILKLKFGQYFAADAWSRS